MAKLSSDLVGRAFVEMYYKHLHIQPEGSHGFYENSSLATWDMKDCVTTQKGIHDMIMSSDFKDCIFQIDDIRTQDSVHGTILVLVSGVATGKEKLRKFIQTFVLARHETAFFVLNDILHFVKEDNSELMSQLVFNSEPGVHEPAVVDVDNLSNVSQVSDIAKVSEPTIAKITADETQPEQIVSAVVAPPKEVQEVPEVVVPVVKEVVNAAVAVPEVVPTVSVAVSEVKDANCTVSEAPKEDAPKLSYLEMVSKGKTSSSPIPSTTVVRVSHLALLPGEEKAKARALLNGSSRAKTLASETKPETPSTKNIVHENNNMGLKSIYIGGLPPETTEEDLAFAVKVFGRVKKFSDSVRVIRAETYSFGFVHFQFAESAKKAVEAKVITVLGKEARISYKISGKRASNGGNENRGRSPSGRGSGTHSRTPSSRAPSVHSCGSPRNARQNAQLNRSQNGEVNNYANNNGKTRHVSSQQDNNGKARHVSSQQANGGKARHVSSQQDNNGKTAHFSSQQDNNGEVVSPGEGEEEWTVHQRRRQRSRNDKNNSQSSSMDQRSRNGNADHRYHHHSQGNGGMRDGERNEPRRQNGGGGAHNGQKAH